MNLPEFARDFADALVAVDGSGAQHKQFRPGIGPFGERAAIASAVNVLKQRSPAYACAGPKQLIDLLIPDKWMIEAKIARPFGDNDREAEHWCTNLLHPYRGNVSALSDCLKLIESD